MGMTVVFLGSFDPPTYGHIHLISEALSHGASEVLMVPAFGNPWKTHQTHYQYRLEMCKRITSMYEPGQVKILEVERELAGRENLENVPTWIVLENLVGMIGEFKILITNETYREIPKWAKGEEILEKHEFMILSSSHLGRRIPGSIDIISLPISSTLVREKLSEGLPCPEYLPPQILNYIKQNKLYEKVSIHN